MMEIYLNRMNVKIVKQRPTDDKAKPINVIIERTCSTNFGVDFCSISYEQIKLFNVLFLSLARSRFQVQSLTINTAKCVRWLHRHVTLVFDRLILTQPSVDQCAVRLEKIFQYAQTRFREWRRSTRGKFIFTVWTRSGLSMVREIIGVKTR